MKRVLILVSCLTLVAFNGWAATLFESFDNVNDWTVVGNDLTKTPPAGTATATQETTIKQQGTGSIKFVYDYSGNQYYEAGIQKTFSTPVDLSNAVSISFQMYGDDTVNTNGDLIWYIVFNTANGQGIRHVDLTGIPPSGWHTFNLNLRTDMQVYPWVTLHDNPMLNQVTGIQIMFQQVAGLTTPGSFTCYLDNMQLETTGGNTQFYSIDNFNSYATTSSLTSVWVPTENAGGITQVAGLDNVDPFEGSGAAEMRYTISKASYSALLTKHLPQALNLNDINYFKIRVKGDSSVPGTQNPVLFVYLLDASGNAVRAWLHEGLVTDGWTTYIVYTTNGGENSTIPSLVPADVFEQEHWDAGGTCDVAGITDFALRMMETGPDPATPYTFTIKVDDIEYARVPAPLAADDSWSLYQ